MPKAVRRPKRGKRRLSHLAGRIERLQALLGKLVPVPEEWLKTSEEGEQTNKLQPLPCTKYRDLVKAWRKAVLWSDGMDCALSMMLSSVMSINLGGEKLWVKILGPPSSGKTTILEGIAVSKYTVSKDTVTGFYSGFMDKEGKDNSLASKIRGKALLTKEGDCLITAPNRTQILSDARGLYDGAGRTHFKTGTGKDYEGFRMSWLICGTAKLREIDDNGLGARTLDCIIMNEIDEDFEKAVTESAADREIADMCNIATENAESQYSPELAYAMRLTGGYVNYLHENCVDLMRGLEKPSQEVKDRCNELALFVAFARCRPSKTDPDAETERELAARLTKQLTRAMMCIAVVTNSGKINKKVMNKTAKVAMDTGRGLTLEIVRTLAKYKGGLDIRSIALHHTGEHETKIRAYMRHLKKIKVVVSTKGKTKGGTPTRQNKYVLTKRIRKLWRAVRKFNY